MAYLTRNRLQALQRSSGTRNRLSTDLWAFAEAISSSMLDISTSKGTGHSEYWGVGPAPPPCQGMVSRWAGRWGNLVLVFGDC